MTKLVLGCIKSSSWPNDLLLSLVSGSSDSFTLDSLPFISYASNDHEGRLSSSIFSVEKRNEYGQK